MPKEFRERKSNFCIGRTMKFWLGFHFCQTIVVVFLVVSFREHLQVEVDLLV